MFGVTKNRSISQAENHWPSQASLAASTPCILLYTVQEN